MADGYGGPAFTADNVYDARRAALRQRLTMLVPNPALTSTAPSRRLPTPLSAIESVQSEPLFS